MTFEELEEKSKKIATRSNLDRDLVTAEDDQKIRVVVVLHAKQWNELRVIMAYHQEKGDFAWNGISQALWHLVDKAYNGIRNSTKKKEGSLNSPTVPSRPVAPMPSPEEEIKEEPSVEYENPIFFREDD